MPRPSYLSKLAALAKLTRPNNVGLIIVAVIAGAALGLPPLACPTAGLKQIFLPLLSSALALSLVAIGGYSINDLLDRESDKISHPKRPLVNGSFSHPAMVAIIVTIVSWLGALALGWFVAGGEFWIIVGCLVLSFVYALWLKRAGIFGNLTVALMTSLALAYGATVIHTLQTILPLIILAFLTNLARELYKDVEDAEGDQKLNSRSLPLTIGEKPTRIIGSGIAFTVVPVLLYFYLSGMLF
ncbi:UbiA family prenyltransferase, partial [bacterium]|nr:UbiA family prenyltransferase [bacterium]